MEKKDNDKRVSEHTRDLLKRNNYGVRVMKNKKKYYRKDAMLNKDYNLLENQYVVRRYFCKKFDMSLRELELLLYLFPKGYFSHQDYKNYPLSYTHRQISSMIKKDFVMIFSKGDNLHQHVYCLTRTAKTRVQVYYKYLSGELEIPVRAENNPLVRKDANEHEKKIINMFHILRKQRQEKNDD